MKKQKPQWSRPSPPSLQPAGSSARKYSTQSRTRSQCVLKDSAAQADFSHIENTSPAYWNVSTQRFFSRNVTSRTSPIKEMHSAETHCVLKDSATQADFDVKETSTQALCELRDSNVCTGKALSQSSLVSKPLDPGFSSWSFLLQGGERQWVGEGAFGKVFKALTDRYQTVAVKIVPLTGNSTKMKRVLELEKRGVDILKSVRHSNIVQFLKCEQTSEGFCIFTELVSGHSLWDLMQRQGKAFGERGVRDFSAQICRGLDFLHCQPQGPILHRDIKCSNIMLTHEGAIKLIDFGLAKEIASSCGLSTMPCGTSHFMAPELFGEDASIPFSVKTDVWAFGCTVFEMTEMQPPDGNVPAYRIPVLRFHKREMPQISEQFSAGLREFYRLCVAMKPKERSDTAQLLRHSFLIASS